MPRMTIMSSDGVRIGIVGFGFSGLMVAANLIRETTRPLTLYLIAETLDGRGVAYHTSNPDHRLNVRASQMSAWDNAPDDFVQWLATSRLPYAPHDFVPRGVYGEYLAALWQQVQHEAQQKSVALQHVPSRATALQAGPGVLTARGDAIACDAVMLATGHEMRPILPHLAGNDILQNPYDPAHYAHAAQWPSPVMLLGSGLTAVDVVLSLRHAGYAGEILLATRCPVLPQAHAPMPLPGMAAPFDVATQQLSRAMQQLRNAASQQNDWRPVVDSLRTLTTPFWQQCDVPTQRRFLRHAARYWNSHRHRMAPEIAARLAAEQRAGSLRLLAMTRDSAFVREAGHLVLRRATGSDAPSRLINCTGLMLDITQTRNPLLRQMLADQQLEAHANGLGIAADPAHRAWGRLYPHLYALGSLLTGQLLESTAVPELRGQAARIATTLLATHAD